MKKEIRKCPYCGQYSKKLVCKYCGGPIIPNTIQSEEISSVEDDNSSFPEPLKIESATDIHANDFSEFILILLAITLLGSGPLVLLCFGNTLISVIACNRFAWTMLKWSFIGTTIWLSNILIIYLFTHSREDFNKFHIAISRFWIIFSFICELFILNLICVG